MARRPIEIFPRNLTSKNLSLELGRMEAYEKSLPRLCSDATYARKVAEMVIHENLISSLLVRAIVFTAQNKTLAHDKPKKLLGKTMGGLIGVFEKLSPNDRSMIRDLHRFRDARDNLTHRLHYGFDFDIQEVRKELRKISPLGKALIKSLRREVGKRQPPFVIKYSDMFTTRRIDGKLVPVIKLPKNL